MTGLANDMIAVAAGTFHSLALDKSGKVWAWGYNAVGQLGDGSNTSSNVPVGTSRPAGSDVPMTEPATTTGSNDSVRTPSLSFASVIAWIASASVRPVSWEPARAPCRRRPRP